MVCTEKKLPPIEMAIEIGKSSRIFQHSGVWGTRLSCPRVGKLQESYEQGSKDGMYRFSIRFQTLLGALTGLCSLPRKEAELNAPAMKPKQTNQHIIPATKKRNKAMML